MIVAGKAKSLGYIAPFCTMAGLMDAPGSEMVTGKQGMSVHRLLLLACIPDAHQSTLNYVLCKLLLWPEAAFDDENRHT